MYTTRVCRDLIAQHFLTVPNCGPENEWHSHHFEVEVIVRGKNLSEHGYVVDITVVEDLLDDIVDRYEDATLNDLPEFDGLNPSIEHFARIIHTRATNHLPTGRLADITVRIWEDEEAWASYSQ